MCSRPLGALGYFIVLAPHRMSELRVRMVVAVAPSTGLAKAPIPLSVHPSSKHVPACWGWHGLHHPAFPLLPPKPSRLIFTALASQFAERPVLGRRDGSHSSTPVSSPTQPQHLDTPTTLLKELFPCQRSLYCLIPHLVVRTGTENV